MALQLNMIFVNLPVKNLERSKAFFTGLGFAFNDQYTNEQAACLVISEHIYAMLLVESYFETFTAGKPAADASKASEVMLALAAKSREQVDEIAEKAVSHGGRALGEPVDHGFMYTRSFEDPDGHLWEIMYMDPKAMS
ncbi:glyoxalase/bleomycin resistance/extradiol dioxygenase family protein [Paenibacillus sambharensis]|uniref:Glyoxalase/bleomycin resistance/extradiol dioxygenase family protein n=1 Tax=Paenibacillus sambharensis TaxID=1803190 RepID=A0A2W1LLN5_9BACL|nr:VOC family protein [Paenibacillus sambharensis]PZD95872.1 glyoxalase/bleomycin resistance/extradiol dioxygenase family protein [Paenibacillus sambharensis]